MPVILLFASGVSIFPPWHQSSLSLLTHNAFVRELVFISEEEYQCCWAKAGKGNPTALRYTQGLQRGQSFQLLSFKASEVMAEKCLIVVSSNLLHRTAEEALEYSAERSQTTAWRAGSCVCTALSSPLSPWDALVIYVTMSRTRNMNLRNSSCSTNK